MKLEKIFISVYLLISALNLINGLTTLTGGYSIIEYTSPVIAIIGVIISDYYISKSVSVIKIIVYIFAIIFAYTSVWILLIPMQTYGYVEAVTFAIKATGYCELVLFIATLVSVIYSLIKMFSLKR